MSDALTNGAAAAGEDGLVMLPIRIELWVQNPRRGWTQMYDAKSSTVHGLVLTAPMLNLAALDIVEFAVSHLQKLAEAHARNPGSFSSSPALARTDASESVQSRTDSPTISANLDQS